MCLLVPLFLCFFVSRVLLWWQTHFTCRHRRSAHSFPFPVLWPKLQSHKKGLSVRAEPLPPPFGTIFICTPRPRKSCADMASKIVAAVHNKKIRKGGKPSAKTAENAAALEFQLRNVAGK